MARKGKIARARGWSRAVALLGALALLGTGAAGAAPAEAGSEQVDLLEEVLGSPRETPEPTPLPEAGAREVSQRIEGVPAYQLSNLVRMHIAAGLVRVEYDVRTGAVILHYAVADPTPAPPARPGACPDCGGSGKCGECVDGKCEECWGSGTGLCARCGGSGACPECDGIGGWMERATGGWRLVDCPDCEAGECAACGETGLADCVACGHTGLCPVCGGSDVCARCGGSGSDGE